MSQSAVTEVDCQLVCLNNSETIRLSVSSLLANQVKKLVVVDGGSNDGTLHKIADLPVSILTAPPGIATQTFEANRHMDGRYVFVSEADQVYEPDFISRLLRELEQSGWDGIQARKWRKFGPSYWDKAQSLFLRINQPPPGVTEFISGPQIWRREAFVSLIESIKDNRSYSADTSLAELIPQRRILVGIGNTPTEEIGHNSFRSFLTRMKNYGRGDFYFYSSNAHHWSLARRARSLLHILTKYAIVYPLKGIKLGHPALAVTYSFLVVCCRYGFWISEALRTRFLGQKRIVDSPTDSEAFIA